MQLEQVLEDCNSIDFECGEDELNDFIINDAADYHRSLLAESYLLKDDGHVIAYSNLQLHIYLFVPPVALADEAECCFMAFA